MTRGRGHQEVQATSEYTRQATTDGSPNLTGKKVGSFKRIQERVKEDNPEQEVIFLHCIIHQEGLCKSALQLDHVVKPVAKCINFIKARGLQHHQFIEVF